MDSVLLRLVDIEGFSIRLSPLLLGKNLQHALLLLKPMHAFKVILVFCPTHCCGTIDLLLLLLKRTGRVVRRKYSEGEIGQPRGHAIVITNIPRISGDRNRTDSTAP